MKRTIFTALVLFTLLALTTGTAFAGSALQLVDVSNGSGGPTFTFRVTGEFSQSELNGGFVSVEGGNDYPLYCAQQDEDTVVCHTSKKVAGKNIVVGFGGARFWVTVPDQTIMNYCFAIYDWTLASNEWMKQGEYCTDFIPNDGHEIRYFNPYWDWEYDYNFFGAGFDNGFWSNPGTGYYYGEPY
jgi:hypothetical protein